MRPSAVIGVLLLILGVVRLVKDQSLQSVAPWVSGIAIVTGTFLIVAAMRRRRQAA